MPTRRQHPRIGRPGRRGLFVSLFAATSRSVTIGRSENIYGNSISEREGGRYHGPGGSCGLPTLTTADNRGGSSVDSPVDQAAAEEINYGNNNLEWGDGPSSWEEFGHDNDPSVCGVQRLTVAEREADRHWKGHRPVIVTNVTARLGGNAPLEKVSGIFLWHSLSENFLEFLFSRCQVFHRGPAPLLSQILQGPAPCFFDQMMLGYCVCAGRCCCASCCHHWLAVQLYEALYVAAIIWLRELLLTC